MKAQNLKLIDDKGGYQLYQFEADFDDMLPLPNAIIDSNDKIKIVVKKTHCGQIPMSVLWGGKNRVEVFSQDSLPRCRDYIIRKLEDSAFGNGRPLVENVNFLRGLTEDQIEEDVKGIMPRAGGHDINIAKTYDGVVLSAVHADMPILPIYSLPAHLVQRRLRDNKEYDVMMNVAREIHMMSGNPKDKIEKRDLRGGKIDYESLIGKIIRNSRTSLTSQEVKEGLEYYAFPLGKEIRRHETTLAILDYLKSRVMA